LRSEGGSGCLKAQELSPEQQAAGPLKVEPDGGQESWNTYSNGAVLV
jgi:hypothetical protein